MLQTEEIVPAELLRGDHKVDRSYNEDFKYSHKNIYHDKLKEFEGLVLLDQEGEKNCGLWCEKVFNKSAPLHVEVGSGYGHFMLDFCQKNPNINFVGLDYRFKRSFNLARQLKNIENKNFRYLRAKGERVGHIFSENEVDEFYFFFPDPWPKKRHNKKRLFQTPFLKEVWKILKPDGKMFIKTDHLTYARWMKEFALKEELEGRFEIELYSEDLRAEHPAHFLSSFETKFEKIFLKQNTPIKGIVLKPIKPSLGIQ
ncbi:MAG: tRNA (guanosine(46)-N7)-methyltransferase TrmB [Bacteriovoracaceae bacterium]|jgi:tRNA (guanine-N7-)-methyltransferase|nr:tRNA (guanosine(46)-N7)-methyltransferase TrmB [Bacteriovoracaceae bacterium]